MPGVPKSRGCQVCKRRRIKCDESWPSCLQCRHIKTECPGPTQLVKFINTNTVSTHNIQSGNAAFRNTGSSTFHMRKVNYANVRDAAAEYGRLQFAVPAKNPTTLADRVALRLVTTMERDPAGVTSTFMGYLPEVPRRLTDSSCLRDSADLFCTVWADFRSPRPRKQLIAMPQYGKMLRSLRKALMNGQGHRIETLAAMTLLERTARLFDQSSKNADIHLNGIREVFSKKSLPNPEDQLDIMITNEVHALLLRDWPGSSQNMSLLTSPKKEALDQCAGEQLSRLDCHPFLRDDIMSLYAGAEKLTKQLADFQKLCQNPKNMDLALSIRHGLNEMKVEGRKAAANSLARGIEDGAIKEKPNKTSMADVQYQFSSILLTGLYHAMLMCQLVPLSVIHHLNGMYDTPDGAVIAETRQVSDEIWRLIPAIKSIEPIIAVTMLDGACMSYELAHEAGKDYVLDSILEIDRSVGRFPKDKESLHCAVMERVRILTGRKLNEPIQGLVLG